MNTQICVPCGRKFMPMDNGVFVFEMFQENKEIYKIWKADSKVCPKCSKTILAGMPDIPYAQHFDKDFDKLVDSIKAKKENTIYYWYEK